LFNGKKVKKTNNMKKIAIQGGKASFHDIAAHEFFNETIETIECATFELVCENLESGEASYAFMAIENSIAASILLNYQLIKDFNFHIVGEHQLRIVQNLIALPNTKVKDITKVRSHYMALRQCNEFLLSHPHIEVEEYYDTADSAKLVAEEHLVGEAGIASQKAASLYGLDVVQESIETIKENYTRFLVLSKDAQTPLNKIKNKATLSFELPDKVGSLALALEIVVRHKINLTKIQSIPIIGKPDQYTFYLECTWDENDHIVRCLVELRHIIPHFRILGEYQKFDLQK
jgi:prephenate dehydratase